MKISKAIEKDSKDFIYLTKQLAKFEKLKGPDKTAQRRLANDAFKKKLFEIYLIKNKKKSIAYLAIFMTYSTFLAKPTLYVEDLFVMPRYRGKGLGKMLFNHALKLAKKRKCGRMEWNVLRWNKKAINFYKKMGAKSLDQWQWYRITLK